MALTTRGQLIDLLPSEQMALVRQTHSFDPSRSTGQIARSHDFGRPRNSTGLATELATRKPSSESAPCIGARRQLAGFVFTFIWIYRRDPSLPLRLRLPPQIAGSASRRRLQHRLRSSPADPAISMGHICYPFDLRLKKRRQTANCFGSLFLLSSRTPASCIPRPRTRFFARSFAGRQYA